MSSLALMRWLESTPERYDAGMRVVTLGRISRLHDAIAEAAAPAPGREILEIGCGTGAVSERLAAGGASVTAFDQNPAMLEQARARLQSTRQPEIRFIERTASEIDTLPERAFDAVVASLCLSEMGASERAFVLREAAARLRPGGVLAVADEVVPRRQAQRIPWRLLRGPQVALAWLLAGSLSHPIADLGGEIEAAGLRVRSEQRLLLGSLALVVAERAE
jgi:ubiquinone/menaquinone biosynthesis C-methylase UbiE